jgi:hypothetical protein
LSDRRADRAENREFIPVSELLASHKRIRRVEPEPQVSVDALIERERRPRRPRLPAQEFEPVVVAARGRRHAPLVLGAAAVVAVLCGALVATYLVGRSGDQDAQPAAAPENISAAKVFQPDAINASLLTDNGKAAGPGGGADADQTEPGEYEPDGQAQEPTDPAAPDVPPAEELGVPAQPDTQEAPAGSQSGAQGAPAGSAGSGAAAAAGQSTAAAAAPPAQRAASSPTTTTATDPVTSTIMAFYAAAPSDPATAYAMLAPSVRDGTLEEFAASWQGVSSAVVQSVKPAGPNAAVVRVTLLRTDGTRLVTNQRIEVSTGPNPTIVDARLLSASLA